MPNEFTLIGERRDDESHLLVLGEDGHYYSYLPARESLSPTELDEGWVMFEPPTPDVMEPEPGRVEGT